MFKRKWAIWMALIALIGTLLLSGCSSKNSSGEDGDGQVTIRYWQYDYASRVNAMNELIKKFEAENPDIKVIHETFPYEQYQQKVAAAMQDKKNQPEIINMYMGWEPKFIDQGFLQPIPDELMTAEEIESHFVPMIKDYQFDGKYYALPIAVRTLAFFWNKDLFAEAGLDPEKPPQTWDEVLAVAKQLTKYDASGTLQQSGYGWNVTGQDYHLFMQVLLRQWGGQPFSDDNRKVTMNSEAGYEAFKWWMEMNTVHRVGKEDFLGTYDKAFLAGKTAMITDGSFRLGGLKDATFNWGVTELPTKTIGGEKHTFGSFFANGITANVSGKKLEASIRFLKFLISDDTMRFWLENVGEIPASNTLANDPALQNDPKYGAFVRGLSYAHATFFADEAGERDAFKLGTDEVVINGADYKAALDQIVESIQQIRDEYFSNH